MVGAGFIGLELVENLVRRGIATTLVELQDQVLPPFDKEMTAPIAAALRANGVALLLGESAEAFEPAGDGLAVGLKSGQRLPAHLVILGIGVRPENNLAVEAGLAVGPRGGIQVDRPPADQRPGHLRRRRRRRGPRLRHRRADSGAAGRPGQPPGPDRRRQHLRARQPLPGDPGHGDRARLRPGGRHDRASPRSCSSRAGRPYQKVYVHPTQHAGYYPGARPMTLKLLFEPGAGTILGAQIVGEEGVDKRIDVLAVAIQARMTVFDLEEVELAYSPQYGSAKDPVNMAGFVAGGVARGDHPQVHVEDLPALVREPSTMLVDVRTRTEYDGGAIPARSTSRLMSCASASTPCLRAGV